MKFTIPTGIMLALAAFPLRAQSFVDILQRADSADGARQYARAAQLYEQAYGLSGFDPAGLAIAARSAARGGLNAIALRDLGRAVNEGYLDQRLLADSAFNRLRTTAEFRAIDARLRQKLAAINQPVRDELLKLANQDQANRQDFSALMKKVASKTPEGIAAFKAFNTADSAIQSRVKEIIAQIGWPTRSKVGDDGAHAAWLVVQHMPANDQAAMLPKLLAAVKAGEAQPGDGALLEDRVLVRSGKPQRYGSQLALGPDGGDPKLDPIEDEPCVDARRKRVGLEPLAEYLKRYGIVYHRPGRCSEGR